MTAWRQVSFEIQAPRAGLAEAAFEACGAVSVTWGEAADTPAVLEPAPGQTRLWDRVRMVALFDADADPAVIRQTLTDALGALPSDWSETHLADQAWERAWLEHFKPLHCGGNLWVVPFDYDPPDPTAVNIRLDPGLAFGTGTHPTTALCLEALAAHPPVDECVIDYGCGSGLLAIAALKLGARQVVAIDNDPQALIATQENAERNGVSARLVVGDPSLSLPVADRVLANILAGVLEALAPTLTAALRPGGRLTLAGLLAEQSVSVRRAYDRVCDFGPEVPREGWVRLDGVARHL